MRAFGRLDGTPYQVSIWILGKKRCLKNYKLSTGLANFLSGGLASFVYWLAAIPHDNAKKCFYFAPVDYSRTLIFTKPYDVS